MSGPLHASILTLFAMAALVAGEAAPAVKLPPAAQTTLDRLAKAEAKIDADAAKLRSAERQKAIKELDKALQAATKAGDLDAAMAVKARIEELRKADEADTAALLGDEKPALKDPAKLAVGQWTLVKTNGIGGQVELLADKTAHVVAGPYSINGIWQIEKERLVIQWGANPMRAENLAFDGPDRLAGDSFDAGKDGIVMTRIRK